MSQKNPSPVPPEDRRAAMIALGKRVSNGELSKSDIGLATFVGYEPARDLYELIGGEVPNTPTKPEEFLEVLESWPGAHIRALIASAHARIRAEEINLEALDPQEKKYRERSVHTSRNILNTIESYFLSRDMALGLDLTTAASSLDEGIGETAQMMSEGQLSEQSMGALAIDLELEKLIRFLGLMIEETHGISLPALDVQAIQHEILAWILEKKDPIAERVVTRLAQQRQQSTRDHVTDVTEKGPKNDPDVSDQQ